MKIAPYGLHHTIIVQGVEGQPGLVVPVLYLKQRDGQITGHAQLHEYLLANRNMSLQWKRDTTRAVGLFWDLLVQAEEEAKTWTPTNIHRAIFRRFCEALQFGTINPETKLDRLGLYWPSTTTKRAKVYVEALSAFLEWVYKDAQGTGKEYCLTTLKSHPASTLSAYPKDYKSATRFMVVAQHLRNISFFHHLKDVRQDAERLQRLQEQELYLFGDHGGPGAFNKNPFKYTEPEIVAALLKVGFLKDPQAKIPEEYEDITAKMIFLLQAFGGCRISEPYHLWFNDVIPASDFACKVFLRHPAEADTHIVGEKMTRKEYLARFGLLPRNQDHSTQWYHAGWKHLATDSNFNAPVFWLHPGAEAMFTTLYARYLEYRNDLLIRRRQRGLKDHPFLFVSAGEDRNAGISKVGDPYSIHAFYRVWEKAMKAVSRELGLEITVEKESGTSPHGLRHFFGQALTRSSQHPKVIQKALRHRTVLSQEPYTAADFKRVNEALSEARNKVQSGEVSGFDLSAINTLM